MTLTVPSPSGRVIENGREKQVDTYENDVLKHRVLNGVPQRVSAHAR